MTTLALLLSCAPYPEGLRATPDGDGPVVRVDWDAKPLPDIPYPNDLATRVDPTSPTGLRLNVPTDAPTHMERYAREKLDTLDGFGIYAPISVAFDAPLDLDDLARRMRDDTQRGDAQFVDDSVLVIDVDPDSPGYLRPVAVDLGQGRFPMDVPAGDRYFPNDTRTACPSFVFDTVAEDLDGDGELDWGEDLDDDGILDVPNVYPEGGDPRDDLLTWYERATNTLILRPVRPLREETTYAVVLTNRLVDAAGESVRSPWAYVNHLRQTRALEPLRSALPDLGLSVDDVAFAWVFTTGRVTGDLVDARRGLLGQGPLAGLRRQVPEGVQEAVPVTDLEGQDPYVLPAATLIDTLSDLGLFPEESADVLLANYRQFAQAVVGGAFHTPNLLGEPGQAVGAWPQVDDSDDWWQVDGTTGTFTARDERVTFTCVIPKGVPQPAPVAVHGHGYGSSRFEFLGFAWAFSRIGVAVCSFDYFGHGPSVSPDEALLIEAVLGTKGLLPFYRSLTDTRYRDLDNDGAPDSGADQWTADAFHTRDVVRQAALDHARFFDSLRACGTGTMTLADGTTRTSCDWDGDGTPDLGGPDVRYFQIGGSLGGINTTVAASVIDGVTAWAPVVPGGGLMDIAARTNIGGAVEAMHGRLMSPLFIGRPTGDGGLSIVQIVNSLTDMVELPVATIPAYPAGGRVVLENLGTGETRDGYVPEDGTFRVAIAADAASAWEKAGLAGIPTDGPEDGASYVISDPTVAGDPLRISFEDGDGNVVASVDTWETDTTFQGVTYPAGSALVAAAEGLGKIRGSPELRRIAFVFAAILEGGDPIAYAPHLTQDPFPDLDGTPRNVLLMPTPGDTWVNINTGIAIARAAGWIDDVDVDERYGTTVDQFLIDHRVLQGYEEYGPYTCADGSPCLFDVDDLDEGLDQTGAPSEAPLRLEVPTSAGVSALRLPYVRPTGTHAWATPEPDRAFDMATYATLAIASYFQSNGQTVYDDVCLEDGTCDWLAALSGGDTGQDAGGDTGQDTGGDTGADSASDSGADAGTDTAPDTGHAVRGSRR